MISYEFFLDLAIILMSSKIFGLISRKFDLPQVVGALLAGVIFGPMIFGIIEESVLLNNFAELGVIVLMFTAGMETDMNEMKKTGKASMIIAIFGVLIPLAGGFIATAVFKGNLWDMNNTQFLENMFMGVILTATSVSISVETLREMGKLKSPAGTAILGAAIIDDILGIIILSVVMSFKTPEVQVVQVLLRIALFFVFAIVVGLVMNRAFKFVCKRYGRKRRVPIFGFILALLLSYIAEHYFGIADITGAFLAGIIISNSGMAKYVNEKAEVLSYMLLSPVFFTSIGVKVAVEHMSTPMIIFSVILLVIAILSKVLGGGFGARLMGYKMQDSIRIGVGMVSRGEVALIVASKGAAAGLLDQSLFAPIIIVVVITTVITPILLKKSFHHRHPELPAA
ncbi:cation:proton antiporter [Alkalibacter mobilis]|uniref:cation:proton antiporter n=1 Tax=Alkalibacter mobilis TaxID=2787712 RepID=UPI00189D649A|nr:cation:proton antiporter [Alkalibacter mobilis]MBF7095568.1 cation:proton antiporter [Alkalibacter mobilis]